MPETGNRRHAWQSPPTGSVDWYSRPRTHRLSRWAFGLGGGRHMATWCRRMSGTRIIPCFLAKLCLFGRLGSCGRWIAAGESSLGPICGLCYKMARLKELRIRGRSQRAPISALVLDLQVQWDMILVRRSAKGTVGRKPHAATDRPCDLNCRAC
jgi:hypothetical protein